MQRSQAAGLLICGPAGSGKSTLAAALSQMTGIAHLDMEAYAFEKGDNPYRAMRSKAETEAADRGYPQIAALSLHRCQGDFAGVLSSLSRLAMVLSAPQTARLQRLRQRSYDRFGARMLLEGGDLYAQEEAFFRFAAERSPLDAVSWLDELFSVRSCTSDGRRDCGCLAG